MTKSLYTISVGGILLGYYQDLKGTDEVLHEVAFLARGLRINQSVTIKIKYLGEEHE